MVAILFRLVIMNIPIEPLIRIQSGFDDHAITEKAGKILIS